MSDRDAERLADRLEREADDLQRRSGELQDRAKQVGEDWRRKRGDERVPGAPPEAGDEERQEQDEAQEEPEHAEAPEATTDEGG